MIESLQTIAAADAVAPAPRGRRPFVGDQGVSRPVSSNATSQPVDLRLVIEVNEATGGYVYKTLDRRTGEVVNQWPREALLRIKDQDAYAAGDVVTAVA